MSDVDQTIREGEAPAKPELHDARTMARQEPYSPAAGRRVLWIAVEIGLVGLILGLIYVTVLPVIVGRSKNADRFDFQRDRNRPTTRR